MEEYNPNKGIDRKTLEDIIKTVLDKQADTRERRLTGFRGCITYGFIRLESMTNCNNSECSSCKMMRESWIKAVKEEIDGKKEEDM